MARPWRCRDDGLELAVRVTPRAAREGIEGVRTDAAGQAWLVVRVTAPAEGGRANAAVAALLARALGVAKSRIRLVRGAAARTKWLRIEGDAAAVARRLAETVGQGERGR